MLSTSLEYASMPPVTFLSFWNPCAACSSWGESQPCLLASLRSSCAATDAMQDLQLVLPPLHSAREQMLRGEGHSLHAQLAAVTWDARKPATRMDLTP